MNPQAKNTVTILDLNLGELPGGALSVSKGWGGAMEEAGAMCFHDRGHSSGVVMKVDLKVGKPSASECSIHWTPLTPDMVRTWNDLQDASEVGAYGIALLLMTRLTEYTTLERSKKGPGFDYWLGFKTSDEMFPFQRKARLEVSGILDGTDSQIRSRVKEKLEQTQQSDNLPDGPYPAYVVVVEFGRPVSQVVRR